MSDVIADPRQLPLGSVLTHPGGQGRVVRMQVGDDTGRGQHCWQSLPGYELPAGRRLHHVEVVGWLRTQTHQVDVPTAATLAEVRRRIAEQPPIPAVRDDMARIRARRDEYAHRAAARPDGVT